MSEENAAYLDRWTEALRRNATDPVIFRRMLDALVVRASAVPALDETLNDLVTLVRFGFIVTVGGERTRPEHLEHGPLGTLLMAIVGAPDVEAAQQAVAAIAASATGEGSGT